MLCECVYKSLSAFLDNLDTVRVNTLSDRVVCWSECGALTRVGVDHGLFALQQEARGLYYSFPFVVVTTTRGENMCYWELCPKHVIEL